MDDLKLYASEKSLESLIQTVRGFSNYIVMELGLEKCAALTMKEGKMVIDEIAYRIKRWKDWRGWQLQVFRSNTGRWNETPWNEGKSQNRYYRRVRKTLETNLNGGNIIIWINTWAISLLRYSVAFLDWTEAELEQMDRETRKLMTTHRALNPKSNLARIYLSGKGARGLITVEDSKIGYSWAWKICINKRGRTAHSG